MEERGGATPLSPQSLAVAEPPGYTDDQQPSASLRTTFGPLLEARCCCKTLRSGVNKM